MIIPQRGDQSVTTFQSQTDLLTSWSIQKREKNQGLTWSGENAFQSTSKPVSKGFYETESFP